MPQFESYPKDTQESFLWLINLQVDYDNQSEVLLRTGMEILEVLD